MDRLTDTNTAWLGSGKDVGMAVTAHSPEYTFSSAIPAFTYQLGLNDHTSGPSSPVSATLPLVRQSTCRMTKWKSGSLCPVLPAGSQRVAVPKYHIVPEAAGAKKTIST